VRTTKNNTKGATITDYAILVALLSVVAIGALFFMGNRTEEAFSASNTAIETGVDSVGGGNGNGNGNGNGGGGTPQLPNEANRACVTDATGLDNFQEASGSKGYTFPGDCLLITNDGGATFLGDNTLHAPVAYHVRIATSAAGANHVFVRASIGSTFLHQAGDATIITTSPADHVWFEGKASTDFTANLMMPSAPRLIFTNGDEVILGGLFGDAAMGPAPAQVGTLRFTDRTFTKQELHDFIIGDLDTPSDETIFASDMVDTIVLDAGGTDVVEPYFGDDTIQVRSAGDKTIQVSSGVDTLDLATVASTSVLRAKVGSAFVLTTPTGTITLSGAEILRAGTEGPIERVVFSDTTMDQDTFLAWMDSAP
jgi:Flp pilus assembly pilin Flp